MAEANIASEGTPAAPTWRRVPELADLVEIFEPGVQVCAWQREIDPDIDAYLAGLHQTGEVQVLETVSPATEPKPGCLPAGPGRASLIDDLSLLREVVCELLGCAAASRWARKTRAPCLTC